MKRGLTTNIVKQHVSNLVKNKVISKFMANVNPTYLGYSLTMLLTIRLNKEPSKKLEKKLADFGQVYFHVQGPGDVAVFGLAIRNDKHRRYRGRTKEPSYCIRYIKGCQASSGSGI